MQPLTLAKSGILYVNKGNSVIHTTPGIQVQVVLKLLFLIIICHQKLDFIIGSSISIWDSILLCHYYVTQLTLLFDSNFLG